MKPSARFTCRERGGAREREREQALARHLLQAHAKIAWVSQADGDALARHLVRNPKLDILGRRSRKPESGNAKPD